MSSCINTKLPEYQLLSKQSGVPDFYLSALCGTFIDKYGRFPNLDEIKGADSEPYLIQQLDLKNGTTSIDKILNYTGTENLQEAVVKLNNIFRDKEITIVPLNNQAKVNIQARPKTIPIIDPNEMENVSSSLMFESTISKLQNLYGINIHQVNNETIKDLEHIPGISTAKAFVYNNEIYVNTDLSDKDAPIHEMMHILLGSVRTQNPDLYFQLVDTVSSLSIFNYYKDLYKFRTQGDVAEEAFVTEFSKLAAFGQSNLDLDEATQYELLYNAKRVLDSILMGQSSIKGYSNAKIFNSSLMDLCKLTNSSLMGSDHFGHRVMSNLKQELLENGELEEVCNG